MKIVRYFFVGAVAATVDIGLFGLLVKGMGLPWFPVSVFSFLVATGVNYWLSIRHVFVSGARFRRHHEAMLVYVASGIGLAVNQAVLWMLIEHWRWDALLAKLAATACVFFWNYGIRRQVIFRGSH